MLTFSEFMLNHTVIETESYYQKRHTFSQSSYQTILSLSESYYQAVVPNKSFLRILFLTITFLRITIKYYRLFLVRNCTDSQIYNLISTHRITHFLAVAAKKRKNVK